MDRKTIVKALECSNKPANEVVCKEGCPYFLKEAIPAESIELFGPIADEEIDGVPYCYGCDYERICEDAARMLMQDEILINEMRGVGVEKE